MIWIGIGALGTLAIVVALAWQIGKYIVAKFQEGMYPSGFDE